MSDNARVFLKLTKLLRFPEHNEATRGGVGGANIEQQINVSLFHKPYISLDCLLLDSRKSVTRMTMLYTIANL